MKLIVGLGNPGKKYELNRHNVGFMILDTYITKNKLEFKKDKNSLLVIDNQKKVIFLKPQTYMNESGKEVKRIMEYYKIAINDLLVIQDDKDIEFEKLKLKMNSSSGGHNGIKDIINYCGTSFLRLKIGVKNDSIVETAAFVLDNFNNLEQTSLSEKMNIYIKIIDDFINCDSEYVINKYNGDNSDI